MRYNVGDRVLIVSHRTSYMNQFGYADQYLNTVMTIRDIRDCRYKMNEDYHDPFRCGGWYWSDDEIVGKVVDENRLVKC